MRIKSIKIQLPYASPKQNGALVVNPTLAQHAKALRSPLKWAPPPRNAAPQDAVANAAPRNSGLLPELEFAQDDSVDITEIFKQAEDNYRKRPGVEVLEAYLEAQKAKYPELTTTEASTLPDADSSTVHRTPRWGRSDRAAVPLTRRFSPQDTVVQAPDTDSPLHGMADQIGEGGAHGAMQTETDKIEVVVTRSGDDRKVSTSEPLQLDEIEVLVTRSSDGDKVTESKASPSTFEDQIQIVVAPTREESEALIDDDLLKFKRLYDKERAKFYPAKWNAERAEKLLELHREIERVKASGPPKDRNWTKAVDLAIKAYGLDPKEIEKGNRDAGTVYVHATLISLLVGVVPTAFSAFRRDDEDPLVNAACVFAGQLLVMFVAPWLNALSHMCVSPAQDLLFRGKCTIVPETAGARPIPEVREEMAQRQATCDDLLEQLEELDRSIEADASKVSEAEGQLEEAAHQLEQSLQDCARSLEANKISSAGQYWTNLVRAMRSLANTASALAGPLTGSRTLGWWIQFGGMITALAASVPAARADQSNKFRQQLVTMFLNKDFRTDAGRRVPFDQLQPEHMDTQAFSKTMELPFAIRVKHEKKHLEYRQGTIERDMGQLYGLTALQMRKRTELFDVGKAGTAEEQKELLDRLDKIWKSIAGGATSEKFPEADWHLFARLLGRRADEDNGGTINAEYLKLQEGRRRVLTKPLEPKPGGAAKLERLRKDKATVDQAIKDLDSGEWKRLPTEVKEDLLNLMRSHDELGRINPLYPVTITSGRPAFTATAQESVTIGMRQSGRPEEFIAKSVQKVSGNFQCVVGGSSAPTAGSAGLRLAQELVRRKGADPEYMIPAKWRYLATGGLAAISLSSAFASPHLISEQNRVRRNLREGAKEGTLDINPGKWSNFSSGAFWRQWFTALRPGIVAQPVGAWNNMMARWGANGLPAIFNWWPWRNDGAARTIERANSRDRA